MACGSVSLISEDSLSLANLQGPQFLEGVNKILEEK